MGRCILCIPIMIGLIILTARCSYAYVDPGAGSYMLQIMTAGILAGLFVVKAFWRSLKEGLVRLIHRDRKQ